MRKKKLKKKLIYCAQDIRSWEGYRILQVKSNRLDRNVRITLINDDGHVVKLFLNLDICAGLADRYMYRQRIVECTLKLKDEKLLKCAYTYMKKLTESLYSLYSR